MFDSCGVLRPEWQALLVKHSDKLMYGSDYYANQRGSWFGYFGVIDRYRRIAGQLPPDVAARISWGNAAALYGRASLSGTPPP
jgi:predicted TIM-barrel fold metal-dependent hydrolase